MIDLLTKKVIQFLTLKKNMNKICVTYTHHKLGDLIWQLPYIKAISDYHNEPIDLVVRKKTQAKNILADVKHINDIFYNDFRKGFGYWADVLKLTIIFYKKKYDNLYMLDKVNKPAIAAKIAGIKNIIGPGLGNQKNWITTKKILDKKDTLLSYTEQSQKLLEINSIPLNNQIPNIEIDIDRFKAKNLDILKKGKKISFGVDSFEDFKMWYEDDFVNLADLLYEKKLFDYIYLICGPDKSYIADKIIKLSKKDYFIDCSNKDLGGIIFAIKNSDFFVGNNSGPLNLAAALNVKSFGLIANDPISELKYSKIFPITPDGYIDNTWNRDRKGMKKLTVNKVFNVIEKELKN
jgi:heptosyltransferase-2